MVYFLLFPALSASFCFCYNINKIILYIFIFYYGLLLVISSVISFFLFLFIFLNLPLLFLPEKLFFLCSLTFTHRTASISDGASCTTTFASTFSRSSNSSSPRHHSVNGVAIQTLRFSQNSRKSYS